MFYIIVTILFLIIFALIAYFLIDLLITVKRMLNNASKILEVLKKEQEFIDNVFFRSRDAIENLEETVKTVENVAKFAMEIKERWTKVKPKHEREVSI